MPSTDLAPARRVRPHRRPARPAHLSRPTGPDRWDPPALVGPGDEAPAPAPTLDRPPARHFGTTAIPARHHWVLDTLMVLGGLAVLVLLVV
jgi:hypothetical protein